ncbi:bifunctional phosphoribosyl-AMP cyclohydrolase/phosphoribosyl-ATP diphosphatase HisIE [Thermalbibacter longus]|uniref:bifunctional phosphoribosyl-AMP cyclohydrolase/phosphoribosyl-ATP diphosphatase HisIE n=1 Tax=Thermalbibacter longus TaxID=2951981 RepID=UPI0024C21B4D|nr:bifunctional phosphoribosyl-AMP cyclohydrolase/phosphoribosyl-ATP diphosphatase HisIE [Thermalbibacter longus]
MASSIDDVLAQIRFDERGLVPAIVQDAATGQVRMLGYANAEAIERTLATGLVHFWSRSRERLWMKGETSGHILELVELRPDCDGDALLIRVRPRGPTCHLGRESCFDSEPLARGSVPQPATVQVIEDVASVIAARRREPRAGSYTSYLFQEGIDKIAKKIGEESAEVIIAAKNADASALANEAADLLYHLVVLLEAAGVDRTQVWSVLRERRGRTQPDQGSVSS